MDASKLNKEHDKFYKAAFQPNQNYKHQNFQSLPNPNNNINSSIDKQSVIHRFPKSFTPDEYNGNPMSNANFKHCYDVQKSRVGVMEAKPISYTAEMIRDQELLVSSMTQQGISEALIRRQFERLLEEQNKQLGIKNAKVLNKSASKEVVQIVENQKQSNYAVPEKSPHRECLPAQENPKCPQSYYLQCNEPRCISHQDIPINNVNMNNYNPNITNDQNHRCISHQDISINNVNVNNYNPNITDNENFNTTNSSRKMEPSSLLQIRLKKAEYDLQKRNNGLQEPAKALQIIQTYKHSSNKNKHKQSEDARLQQQMRLNGIQNKNDMNDYHLANNIDSLKYDKRLSANGLENFRISNHPSASEKSHDQYLANNMYTGEYPQRIIAQSNINMLSNSDNKHLDMHNHLNKDVTPHYHSHSGHSFFPQSNVDPNTLVQKSEAQHNTQDNLTYHPELQEAKVIGGVTYFARKPQCIPNIPGFLCDNYTHTDHSKQAAAF